MNLCDYGCGKSSKFLFKNGKQCCSEKWQYCDYMKKSISSKLKGRQSPNKNKKFSDETKRKMSLSRIRNIPWNKNKRVLDLNRIKQRYPFFYKVEKIRETNNGIIEVKCYYCKKWFAATNNQLSERIRQLERPRDNSEQHFYCSELCKKSCFVYNSKPSNSIKNKIYENDLNIWRYEVLKIDDNKCVYCGNKATQCHHIIPISRCIEFALDPQNGISVCDICHLKYCHKDECSTGNLLKESYNNI